MYMHFVRNGKAQCERISFGTDQTAGTLLRCSFLVSVSNKAFPLHVAHFIQTITSPRMTWSLPWRSTIILSVMVAGCLVPAPFWAAAIAPLPAERDISGTISIPTFNVSNATTLWEGDPSFAVLSHWLSEQGRFTFDIKDKKEALLVSAREASTLTNGVIKHAKLDRTGFTYEKRSYGTGASAGFTQSNGVNASNWYHFNETGFRTSISCFYNSSIESAFYKVSEENSPIGVWQSQGKLADGSQGGYISYAAWMAQDLFAWNHVYNQPARKIQLQLFIGAANETEDSYNFSQLKDIQCDIDFKLQKFKVSVNNTSQLVSAVPLNESELAWPPYGDAVVTKLDEFLGGLTFIDSCAGGCTLGQALLANINQLFYQSGDTSDATKLTGIQEYFASLVDNMLINLLLARWVSRAPDPTEDVSAIITVPALVLGDMKFVVIIGVLNLAILLLYIFELIRTRAWVAIPPLDIMNDSEVIIAAFEGGRLFERRAKDVPSLTSGRQRVSENTTLRLQYDGVKPILMPQGAEEGTLLLPDAEPLLGGGFTSGFENVPLAEIRRSR
jgi:hypothetical protein